MNTACSLPDLSLHELASEVRTPKVSSWCALKPQELSEIVKRCRRHWTADNSLLWSTWSYVAFSLLLSTGWMILFAIGRDVTMGFLAPGSTIVLISTLVLTFILLLISAAIRATLKLNTAQRILDQLAPIANSDFYRLSALGYVRDSQNAQDYMNEVRATGRMLCVVDFHIAYKLAMADRGTQSGIVVAP
jgi:hypothetical protein